MTRIFHTTIFLFAGILANSAIADKKSVAPRTAVHQTGAEQKPVVTIVPVTGQIRKVASTNQDLTAQRMRDFINQLKTKQPDSEV